LITSDYKKLIRIYIDEDILEDNKKIALENKQVHYLKNVMRKTTGDELRIFNGKNGEWLAKIEVLKKSSAILGLIKEIAPQKTSSDVWVMASPIKKSGFEMMIEKSCELGAAKFIPVIFEHSVVHKINIELSQSIAIEAAEQSERLDIMNIEVLIKFEDFLESLPNDRDFIFCQERSKALPIAKAIKELSHNSKAIIIGPEGGFTDQEIDSIGSFKNIHAVSLGNRILKAETAAISALSAIQFLSDYS